MYIIKRITYISFIIFNFTINEIFELRFNIFNYFWMIHYYQLFIILSLICLSSFILSYLLSFIFAMCFLLTSDLIILLISSTCSSNERICSNVLYSVNWLPITFIIRIFFLNERDRCFVNFDVRNPSKVLHFFNKWKGLIYFVNFGVLNPSKVLWHNYFICIVTFLFIYF